MPELPEVETVRRALEQSVQGAIIGNVMLRRKDLRVPFPPGFAKALCGQRIASVRRRAKYLLLELENGQVWLAHLGMSGRFSVGAPAKEHDRHDHVVVQLQDGRELIYNDARRFGLMAICPRDALAQHPLLAGLGPEPLDDAFSPAYLEAALLRRSGPVKPALMDQALVVGVGNIYASEALFLAGIHPQASARDAAAHAPALVRHIRHVLQAAIASGGSSLRDFFQLSGETGYFQHQFQVYGRQGKPCFSCKSAIETLRQAGRSSFFCPHCQKQGRSNPSTTQHKAAVKAGKPRLSKAKQKSVTRARNRLDGLRKRG
jgi:formamidopyrimidine-DNA glycosylase